MINMGCSRRGRRMSCGADVAAPCSVTINLKAGLQPGQLTECNGLQRRPDVKETNVAHWAMLGLGQDPRHGVATHPALAWSHAGASKGLDLVGPGANCAGQLTDLTCCDLLTATDNRLISGCEDLRPRLIERIQKGTQCELMRQTLANRPSIEGGGRLIQTRQFHRNPESRQLAAQLCGLRARDAGAVSSDEYIVLGAFTPRIQLRHVAILLLVPLHGAA